MIQTDDRTNQMLAVYPVHCQFRDKPIEQRHVHSHEGFELYFCTSGTGIFVVQDRMMPLRPGTVFLIPPHIRHAPRQKEGHRLDRWVVSVSQNYMYRMLEAHSELAAAYRDAMPGGKTPECRMLQLGPGSAVRLQEIFRTLAGELTMELALKNTAVQAKLVLALTELEREKEAPETGGRKMSDEMTGIAERILIYISEHFEKEIKLEHLCAAFHISRSHLSQLFKRTTGLTVNRYLVTCRINKAKELLTATGLNVMDICELSGFQDISHFCSTFKKETGMTPSVYRELYSANLRLP
ncbi:AraC family transcriptional regulator [Paenibacillus sp. N4]|uniref:AraC family transcriptional regulator n=1 Tax=Paenibacillus vietnamensis TaxID=2590547 RepID=UPI001CD0948B|nr:AraC family transcriptional regulator [Paenibacillus vietnamensis]MCA0754256.1 AraC family transcriptional regulator [Paenibacillus vietnamensis]